jgi:hypothetical protein
MQLSRVISEHLGRLGGPAMLNLKGISAADVPHCGIAG